MDLTTFQVIQVAVSVIGLIVAAVGVWKKFKGSVSDFELSIKVKSKAK